MNTTRKPDANADESVRRRLAVCVSVRVLNASNARVFVTTRVAGFALRVKYYLAKKK